MGLDTKIYSNHSLQIPRNTKEVVNLLVNSWDKKTEITDSIEVEEEKLKIDPIGFKIFINPRLIEFEYPKFHQITLNTNFEFSGLIKIYSRTICFTPIGIGKNATNMITNFMDESIDFFHSEESFQLASKKWKLFKVFLNNFTDQIGGKNYIYINDGIFSGVEEIAWEGGTIDEMISQSEKIVKPCESKKQFIDYHTLIRSDRVRNVKGDVWFYENRK